MLDDEFLYSLPDDPEHGLAKLYKVLKQALLAQQYDAIRSDYNTSFDLEESRRTLLNTVFAYLAAHAVDLNVDFDMPTSGDHFTSYYNKTTQAIEFHITKTSFQRASREKTGTSTIYVLTPALRLEIHHHLNGLRELIANAKLSDLKRTALSRKLNAFAEEVDRDKTRIEGLASAMIWTRKEVIEGASGLEPVIEKLDKMFQSFAKATEFLRLPSLGEQKQLPPPPKQIEGPKENLVKDEVPF